MILSCSKTSIPWHLLALDNRHSTDSSMKAPCPPPAGSGVHLLRANIRSPPYRRRLGGRRRPALRAPITPNATNTPTATNCCGLSPAQVGKSPRKKSSPNLSIQVSGIVKSNASYMPADRQSHSPRGSHRRKRRTSCPNPSRTWRSGGPAKHETGSWRT